MNTKYLVVLVLGLFCFAQSAMAELVGTYCNPTKSYPAYGRKYWKIPQFEAANRAGQSCRTGSMTCFYFKLPKTAHDVIEGSDGAGNNYEITKELDGTYKFTAHQTQIPEDPYLYTPVGEPNHKKATISYPNYPSKKYRVVEYTLDVKNI